jgi:3-oxoacid CoA-transferase subunit A/glutaconate CoA-transferase subunit A
VRIKSKELLYDLNTKYRLEDICMQNVYKGRGELLGWHDPDENRKWLKEHKPQGLVDKRSTIEEVVRKFVKDGDLIASGGFGHVRVSMAIVYEIIRQEKKNLAMTGKTAVHDIDVLVSAGCANRVEVAYSFGHELRGLSRASRQKVECGECQVVAEISNAAYQWRFLAAMMGIPFIPARVMLGTDTLKKSSAKVVKDPWSGKPVCLLPACYPDVGIIHVSRCDKFGNSQIDGIKVEDVELAGACRKLIITAEKVVDEGVIRKEPDRTVIPFYYVDAVVEIPYGAHPCQMPGAYYYDEEHISEWMKLSLTDEGISEYLDKYVFSVRDFQDYLEIIGGEKRLNYLSEVESLRKQPKHPWTGNQ